DNGQHLVSGFILRKAGVALIGATDKTTPAVTGGTAVVVAPAAANHLKVNGVPVINPGAPFNVTVVALDPYNNVATAYTGTVHFTSSDKVATLPFNYAFVGLDQGSHTFGGVILR